MLQKEMVVTVEKSSHTTSATNESDVAKDTIGTREISGENAREEETIFTTTISDCALTFQKAFVDKTSCVERRHLSGHITHEIQIHGANNLAIKNCRFVLNC